MADYFGTFFISKLPFCFEKQEMVNGVEKTCLVIPYDEAQMGRARNGAVFLKLMINQLNPNPQLRTHKIRLGFRDYNEMAKAQRLGVFERANNLGFLYLRSDDPSAKVDYTNNMTQIFCDGKLFLDSIQREDIKVDHMTGRKYIDFSFRKTPKLDSFGNSHEVIVRTEYGEHQIGVAKELRDKDTQPSENTQQTTENKQTPSEYDGYKW